MSEKKLNFCSEVIPSLGNSETLNLGGRSFLNLFPLLLLLFQPLLLGDDHF
jgi:hypothetical protein